MAIITPTALGKPKGKVGDLIFYEVNGEIRMRSRPEKYKKSKSKTQKAQKERFKGAVEFYWKVEPPMSIGWKVAANETRGSGYNLFIRENIGNFTETGELADVAKLVVCYGKLEIENTNFKAEEVVPGKVKLQWGKTAKNNEEEWQRVQIVVYDPSIDEDESGQIYWLEGAGAHRWKGECEFTLPEKRGEEIHVYVYFQDVNQGLYSKSRYVGTFRREGE